MAKKKTPAKPKKPGAKQPKQKPEQVANPKDYKKGYRDDIQKFNYADQLYKDLGFDKPLDRLNNQLSEGQAGSEAASRFFGDPTSAGFLGNQTQGQSEYLDSLRGLAKNAGMRSDEMKDVVARMQGGLDGLTAQENAALRDTAMDELDRSYNEQLRSLQKMNARGGQGAALMGKLSANNLKQKSDMERDLLVKNIDMKNDRLDKYGGFLNGLEGREFDQSRGALNDYGNAEGSIRDQNARLGQGALDAWRNASGQNADFLRKGDLFNIGQGEKENALRSTGLFGLANFFQNSQTARQANAIAKENARRGGAAAGGGDAGRSAAGGGEDAYYNAVKNIMQGHFGFSDDELANV